MACWFNYPDDGSAHAYIICSSTRSLIFCKFRLFRKPCMTYAFLVFNPLKFTANIGYAIVMGRMDRRSVSFVSSKFSLLDSLLTLRVEPYLAI